MPLNPIYLNGSWLDKNQAQVNLLDRGLQFGDGIYEVIPCYHKTPLCLEAHLKRLNDSLAGIGIHAPMPDWQKIIKTLLATVETPYCYLYLQVTRGIQSPRQFMPLSNVSPTCLLYAEPFSLTQYPHPGVTLHLFEDPRWQYCHLKSTNLLGSILAQQEAQKAGFDDALYHRNGLITEATSSNFFALIDGKVITAPLSQHLLAGITRSICIGLFNVHNKAYEERNISSSELPLIEAAWVCSSTKEIVPIKCIGNHYLNPNHPFIEWLVSTYSDYKNAAQAS